MSVNVNYHGTVVLSTQPFLVDGSAHDDRWGRRRPGIALLRAQEGQQTGGHGLRSAAIGPFVRDLSLA